MCVVLAKLGAPARAELRARMKERKRRLLFQFGFRVSAWDGPSSAGWSRGRATAFIDKRREYVGA